MGIPGSGGYRAVKARGRIELGHVGLFRPTSSLGFVGLIALPYHLSPLAAVGLQTWADELKLLVRPKLVRFRIHGRTFLMN